jgi:hypothetical protein
MGLVKETKRVEVPGEDAWVEIRKMGWRRLEVARKEQDRQQRGIAKEFGAEFVKALSSGDADKARDTARTMRWDIDSFDRMTLLKEGVIKWSYSKGDIKDSTFGDLDEPTADWLSTQILHYARPPGGEERKKTDADSTST